MSIKRHATELIVIQMDSKAGISFKKSTCASSRLGGTFDLRKRRMKELRDSGLVATAHAYTYVATAFNPADLLTVGACQAHATSTIIITCDKRMTLFIYDNQFTDKQVT